MLSTTLAWPQECIWCLQNPVKGAAHTSAVDRDGIFDKNVSKSCWKIKPRSIPSNIATRHNFFLKSAFTGSKIFFELYCQQSCSMILRGTLHANRILRQEFFCKKLDRAKPTLLRREFIQVGKVVGVGVLIRRVDSKNAEN